MKNIFFNQLLISTIMENLDSDSRIEGLIVSNFIARYRWDRRTPDHPEVFWSRMISSSRYRTALQIVKEVDELFRFLHVIGFW